jgi:hypothetical protein
MRVICPVVRFLPGLILLAACGGGSSAPSTSPTQAEVQASLDTIVTAGVPGALLVPAGDVAAFRAHPLYEHPDLRARLVVNAHRRVAALCDLEAFTREMFATLG